VVGAWQTFFSTQAEVSAALTGLVFVALSINLKQILSLPGLADRAGEALLLLLLPVLVGLAGVLPQTSIRALGGEFLGLGLVMTAAVTLILAAGHRTTTSRPPREFVTRATGAGSAVVMTVIAGALLLAGHPGGLWWQAVGTGLCIAAGVADAWVLLVEILR
jgi:hypothetical protein